MPQEAYKAYLILREIASAVMGRRGEGEERRRLRNEREEGHHKDVVARSMMRNYLSPHSNCSFARLINERLHIIIGSLLYFFSS